MRYFELRLTTDFLEINLGLLQSDRNFKLHKSTIFLLLIVFATWAVVAIPGNGRWIESNGVAGQTFEHGWPWVHLSRFVEANEVGSSSIIHHRVDRVADSKDLCFARPAWNSDNHWSLLDNWSQSGLAPSFSSSPTKIHWLSLGLNAGLLLVGLACLAFLLEFRRRRRNSSFQFKLIDIAFLVVVICALLASHKSVTDETRRQQQAIELMRDSVYGFSVQRKDHSPLWLSRLLDNNRFFRVGQLPIGSRATSVDFGSFGRRPLLFSKDAMTAKEFGRELAKLSQVDTVYAWAPGNWGLELQKHFPCDRIRHIEFQLFGNQDFACLKGFQNLERMSIRMIRLDKTNFDYPILNSLRTVELYAFNFENSKVIEWLKKLPNLERIQIRTKSIDSIRNQFENEFPGIVFEAT